MSNYNEIQRKINFNLLYEDKTTLKITAKLSMTKIKRRNKDLPRAAVLREYFYKISKNGCCIVGMRETATEADSCQCWVRGVTQQVRRYLTICRSPVGECIPVFLLPQLDSGSVVKGKAMFYF